MTKNTEEKQEVISDEKYQTKLSDQAEKKAIRQT
jgi:hypothetical protein